MLVGARPIDDRLVDHQADAELLLSGRQSLDGGDGAFPGLRYAADLVVTIADGVNRDQEHQRVIPRAVLTQVDDASRLEAVAGEVQDCRTQQPLGEADNLQEIGADEWLSPR